MDLCKGLKKEYNKERINGYPHGELAVQLEVALVDGVLHLLHALLDDVRRPVLHRVQWRGAEGGKT